jgi:hypothetical protein
VALYGLLKPRSRNAVAAWPDRFLARGLAGLRVAAGRGRKPAFPPAGLSRRRAWAALVDRVRRALVEAFAGHKSLGVQQTLYAMGEAALDACAAVDEVSLAMPNRHRLLVNLTPLGRANPNEVFLTTDEPSGMITGTVRRG